MQVTTDLRRSDLIWLNAYMLFRLRSNLIFIVVVAVSVFAYLAATGCPTDFRSWSIITISSVAGGVGGLLAGFLISLTYVLLSSNEKNGTLGGHVYTLSPEGLHESTTANEALHKWSGIQSVQKSGKYIHIRINSYLFHLIPRRAFGTEKEFQEFWEKANEYWKQAA